MSFSLASAETGNTFFKNSFFNDIKSELGIDKKKDTNHEKQNYDATTKIINDTSLTSLGSTTTATSTIDNSDASSTQMFLVNPEATTTQEIDMVICDDKTKLLDRNDKAKKQLKKQYEDKNKIVISLLKVASSTDATSSKLIVEKISKLEKEFSDVVKAEKDITDVVSITTAIVCEDDIATNKIVTKNNLKIKKLEVQKSKQVEEIKKFIKIDIKNTLKLLVQ